MIFKFTDVWFVIVYLIFLSAYILVIVYSIINGDIKKLIVPVDTAGEYCGIDNNRSNLLILNFKDVSILYSIINSMYGRSQIVTTPTTCVDECPKIFGVPTMTEMNCLHGVEITNETELLQAIEQQLCASYNIPTVEVLNYCFPDFSEIYKTEITFPQFVQMFGNSHIFKLINQYPDIFEKIKIIKESFNEFKIITKSLGINLLTCIVISLVFLFVFSRGIYPLFVILYIVSFLICALGYTMIKIQHNKIQINVTGDDNLKWMYDQLNMAAEKSNIYAYDYLEWIFLVVGLALFFSGCFLHNVVKKACKYAKEVSNGVRVLIENSIIPLISATIQICHIALCVYVLLCIFTSNKNSYQFLKFSNGKLEVGDKCSKSDQIVKIANGCLFAGQHMGKISKIFIFITIFVSIWNIMIARGTSTYLIACSYSNYFTQKEEQKSFGMKPFYLEGIKGLLMYNLGSIIFGSFLITILLIVCFILKIILKFFKIKESGAVGVGVKFLRKFMISIVLFLKKLNERTYIEVAVCQKNFLRSTFEVVSMFAQHPIISLLVVSFNTFFLVFGTVAISILNGFLSYYILIKMYTTLKFYIVHAIIIGIMSLLPSSAILSIYTTGITTKLYFDYHKGVLT